MRKPSPAVEVWALARLLAGYPAESRCLRTPTARLLAHSVASANGNAAQALGDALDALEPEEADGWRRAILEVDPAGPEPEESAEILRLGTSSDSLLTATFPPPVFAIDTLLPAGLTVFAGPSKIGKSWLMLQAAFAVGAGGKMLGKDVEAGGVVYLALEDHARRLQARMRIQGWSAGLPVRFLHARDVPLLGAGGGAGHQFIETLILGHKPRLLVIDTLSRILASGLDQNDVSHMTGALAPIQEVALRNDVAVVLIDHHNKGRAFDFLSDVAGSRAKVAVADTVWSIYGERGKRFATLKTTGRDVDELELALKMDVPTQTWHCIGSAADARLNKAQREVLEALRAMGGTPTTRELHKYTEMDEGLVSRALAKLVDAGLVERMPKIGNHQPYKRTSAGEQFDEQQFDQFDNEFDKPGADECS